MTVPRGPVAAAVGDRGPRVRGEAGPGLFAAGAPGRVHHPHQRRHGRGPVGLQLRPGDRRVHVGALRGPPGRPLRVLFAGVQGRRLAPALRRPGRRQGRTRVGERASDDVRHADRAVVRAGARPPPGRPLSGPPGQARVPPRPAPVLPAPPPRGRPPPRRAPVRRLLRLRGPRAVAVARPRTVAPLHHRPRPTLARNAGVSRRFFARHLARVSYTKVAEFQARGLIHVHAVMRLDGPTGPDSPPRIGLDAVELGAAIATAARAVRLEVHPAGHRPVVLGWGEQIDTRPDHAGGRARRPGGRRAPRDGRRLPGQVPHQVDRGLRPRRPRPRAQRHRRPLPRRLPPRAPDHRNRRAARRLRAARTTSGWPTGTGPSATAATS